MALEYSIEQEQQLVKVTVHGELDYLSMDQMWNDISAACRKYDCSNILGIANITAPSKSNAYDHASIFEHTGMSPNFRIAWVEKNPTAMEMAKFAQAVIQNRGLGKARVFGNTSEARAWLAEAANNTSAS